MDVEKWSMPVAIIQEGQVVSINTAPAALEFLGRFSSSGSAYDIAFRMLTYNVTFDINLDFGRAAFILALKELGISTT